MKNRQIYLLLLASALLLSLPFYRYFSGIVLFIAWVPILFVEDYFTQHREKYRAGRVFLLAWLTFLIWNLLTVYWIWNATVAGAIAAYIINSFVMAVAFWLIHVVHRNLGDRMGHIINNSVHSPDFINDPVRNPGQKLRW
jgi:apolipoprotein N-acyltransferase